MSLDNLHLQRLYQSFLNTPLLWESHSVLGLKQLQNLEHTISPFIRSLDRKLRLGQLAEQFVFNQLEQLEHCKIISENVQIQKNRQTLGELDALIELHNESIHLEIVYKFYLFDETLGTTELEQWIGPNRNDSLIQKLTKLKDKQLPLLYSPECKSTIEDLDFNTKTVKQRVLFKAQLFIPYKTSIDCSQLNKNCITGFYITKQQLESFNTCEFYIPLKLDWFLDVHNSVNWVDINTIKIEAKLNNVIFSAFINKSLSPEFR